MEQQIPQIQKNTFCLTHAVLWLAKDALTLPLLPFPISRWFAKTSTTTAHLLWEEVPNSPKLQSTANLHMSALVSRKAMLLSHSLCITKKNMFFLVKIIYFLLSKRSETRKTIWTICQCIAGVCTGKLQRNKQQKRTFWS